MTIDSLAKANPSLKLYLNQTQEAQQDVGFKEYLAQSVGAVNSLLGQADKQGVDLATGKTENLHEATISMEKAETALKLLMQIRNRALDAYHEVLKMQM